jgi:hypothetical protein
MTQLKQKRGRHDHSGVLTGIQPEREEWSDIRNRIIYGSAEWRLVALRTLVGGLNLPDNFLSKNYLSTDTKELQEQEKALRNKIASFWRPLCAQLERAVLNGDADWFARQAKAIAKGGLPQRVQFNAKVLYLLETEMWATHIRKGDNREDLTLTPAGKFIDATAGQIYDSLDTVECPKEKQPHGITVELSYFENRERCCAAIRKLAETYLKAVLRKEQGKHPRKKSAKPLSTDFYHGVRTAIERLRQVVSTE